MRRSKSEIYLHMVWATAQRRPWVTEAIERDVYRSIECEARQLGCAVLAINGMLDHVHLVVQTPTTVSAAHIARQVKGVSSLLINDHLPVEERFRWQENYGVFSISRSHVKRVIAYVQRQKEHHARGTAWREWEEVDEETPHDAKP